MSTSTIRKIHVACRALGLDGETRRDLQLQVVGKASLTDMTDAEQAAVYAELKRRGFKPKRGKGGFRKSQRGDCRLIFVLWAALAEAGVVKDGSNAALNTFVQRRFGKAWGFVPVDLNTLEDPRKIEDVLKALKDWMTREGVDFDWERVKR